MVIPPVFGKEMGNGFQVANIPNTVIGHFLFSIADFRF
jgi:hypothetical protein